MIELMIVLVILGIAAAIVVPMASSAASMQLRSAVNMVAADLEYAKSMSITTGQSYRVSFDTAANTYEVQDSSGNVIKHPVNTTAYVVSFGDDRRLGQVTIQSVQSNAVGIDELRFDYLGTPYNGATPLANECVVTLEAGGVERYVRVKAVTGLVVVE